MTFHLLLEIRYMEKSNLYLVEFITDNDDYTFVIFANEPSDDEVIEYIFDDDWLHEEYLEETLTWIITKAPFVDNSIIISIKKEEG